jgi:hypothetical protein
MIIIFYNANIKISQNDDWTMFGRILNYSLKIISRLNNLQTIIQDFFQIIFLNIFKFQNSEYNRNYYFDQLSISLHLL